MLQECIMGNVVQRWPFLSFYEIPENFLGCLGWTPSSLTWSGLIFDRRCVLTPPPLPPPPPPPPQVNTPPFLFAVKRNGLPPKTMADFRREGSEEASAPVPAKQWIANNKKITNKEKPIAPEEKVPGGAAAASVSSSHLSAPPPERGSLSVAASAERIPRPLICIL